MKPRVVIVGGGFAGLYAARAMSRLDGDITLVDRRNFHVFQPLLYQVATGALSPGQIAYPLRRTLRAQKNVRVLTGEVRDVDVAARRVILDNGQLPYDTVVVAAGATHSYFGHPEWERVAPGLKTIEDATEIRSRIFFAFEAAERERDPESRKAWLTFVIVGAGPTGAELAGTLGEIARDTLRGDFRAIDPSETRILLLDAQPRVLTAYAPELSAAAERQLIALGVRPLLGARVQAVDEYGVMLASGEKIAARTVIWAAGVQAAPLGRRLAHQTGADVDSAGRVKVGPDLTLPGHPEILVIGDMAHVEQDGSLVPGVAPAAMQMGGYVAQLLRDRSRGVAPRPFRYVDKGSMATLGRHRAIADIRGMRFSGLPAWLFWLGLHIFFLIGFRNRAVVLLEWAFSYFTYNRGARLITGEMRELPEVRGE